VIPVRVNGPAPTIARVFDQIEGDHPLSPELCPGCDEVLGNGEPVALVYVGPGPDLEDREKAQRGVWHTGAAVAVHAVCAGVQS
jgi:hypothetical protein